mmetsp:Transcript_21687/g.74517  ORF Transcript_21687/g.74517 Transcript_21687/m.74517 type:complete len:410 (+) Transcript_21687:158-1387(+)
MPDTARRSGQPSLAHSVYHQVYHNIGGHFFGTGHSHYATVAAEEEEAEDGEDGSECTKLIDIPEDAYGAAILAFVKDVPQLSGAKDSEALEIAMWNCLFALVLLAVNLILQGSILLYVYHYVVALDIARVQNRYAHFKYHVFSPEGEFKEDLWDAYSAREHLCEIAMWNRPFYYAVLSCWSLVMMIEIKKSEELGRHILLVPRCKASEDMMVVKGEHRYVVGFTPITRLSLVFFVAVPKMGISIVLLWLGCEWLSATIKFESLVMNTVAMAFICNIDEILFEAVLPKSHREEVENIDFMMTMEILSHDKWIKKRRQAYRKSLGYLICIIAFIVMYAEYMQDVLPPDIGLVRVKCTKLIFEKLQPLCNGWTWYLRGNPAVSECFPFPPQTQDELFQQQSAMGLRTNVETR